MPGEALPEHIAVDLFRLLVLPQVNLRTREVSVAALPLWVLSFEHPQPDDVFRKAVQVLAVVFRPVPADPPVQPRVVQV